MKESAVLREVEYCLSHFGFMVIPRDTRKGDREWSIWQEVNPQRYVGVVWRNNVGALVTGKRFIRFGVAGLPDFSGFCLSDGKTIGIEVKGPKTAISTDQTAFGWALSKAGGLYGLVRSYQDTETLLKGWGFTRR